MAPEVIRNQPYNTYSDIWSFGTVMYHLMYNEPLFIGREPIIIYNSIENFTELQRPRDDWYDDQIQDCLRQCLQKNPKDRPSALDLLFRFPIFTNEIKPILNRLGAGLYEREFPQFTEEIKVEPVINQVDEDFTPDLIDDSEKFEQWMVRKYGEEMFHEGYEMVKEGVVTDTDHVALC